MQAVVQVGRRNSGFNLQVHGTHINSKEDIAIDDVEFVNCDIGSGGGQCKIGQKLCSNGNCVEEAQWYGKCDAAELDETKMVYFSNLLWNIYPGRYVPHSHFYLQLCRDIHLHGVLLIKC